MYHLGQTAEILRERARPSAVAAPPAGAPAIVVWDPTGSRQPGAAEPLQRGCPVGYFAQLVAPGTAGAAPFGRSDAWVRCRLLRTSTPETIRRESGVSAGESLGVFTGAVRQTLAEAPGRLIAGFRQGLVWVAVGAGALLAASFGVGWLGGRR